MGLVGRREAISAPTVGYARTRTTISTASPVIGLFMMGVTTKVSMSVSTIRTTHTANNNKANHAALRRLIKVTPRPCSLAPYVTTLLYITTVAQALRQT